MAIRPIHISLSYLLHPYSVTLSSSSVNILCIIRSRNPLSIISNPLLFTLSQSNTSDRARFSHPCSGAFSFQILSIVDYPVKSPSVEIR
ncbi:hypothetical protein M413DRAFT_447575 [Hebeloma cylindrosporum]|uniref:Uncharacterized protein n=1 Tax=Hebeloma cylindrosporum TaxID=76867 RepID=A0A0C2XMD7_HEBCY|nr:hypothetical protein M413DRAFT_447575 [Hebeloma cylindrosporum h7]